MNRIEIDESEVEIISAGFVKNDLFIEYQCEYGCVDYMRLRCDTEVIKFRGKSYRVHEFETNYCWTTNKPIVLATRVRLHLKLSNSQKRQDKIDELLSS